MAIFNSAAFLLHKMDYSNTSTIGYFLTQQHGIVHALVRGARRVGRGGMSQPVAMFAHLLVQYSGSGDLKNVRTVECVRSYSPMPKLMLSLTYIHELLLQLLPHSIEVPGIFTQYDALLSHAHRDDRFFLIELRKMELALLDVLGYPIIFDYEIINEQAIQADGLYYFYEGQGFLRKENIAVHDTKINPNFLIQGSDILALASNQWSDTHIKLLKRCTNIAITSHLKYPIKSRMIYEDMIAGENN